MPRKAQPAGDIQPIVTEQLQARQRINYAASGAGEAEGKMRVASLENLLVLATLVSAIVVVLWGIKIYCGV